MNSWHRFHCIKIGKSIKITCVFSSVTIKMIGPNGYLSAIDWPLLPVITFNEFH